ncbi:MAG: beta-lactamase family protein [Proteobacteria bacterium]|nr:beta-lactamase family protein [Pseudomonadota bacterium]
MRLARLICGALAAAWIVVALPAGADTPQAVDRPETLGFAADRLQRVTQVFQGYVDAGQLPGAVVLIARHDKVAYLRAFGFQDREKQIAMAPDAIFRIASMTKPIVTVAAMMLVEEGRLDLAAPVHQYIPEFKDIPVGVETRDAKTGKTELVLGPQKRPMTVQDLLRHTAGLVYGQFGDGLVHRAYRAANVSDRGQSLAEQITKLSTLPLAHQPGEVWEYSMATDVLGRVVEIVSGQTLDAVIAARITQPLGMASTGFHVREADLGRLAQPQIDAASGARPPMADVTKPPRLLSGGGGMVSTASDYLRFAKMLLHRGALGDVSVLAPTTVSLMTADALPPGIGFSARAHTLMADLAPTPAAGQGFGLGFAIRTAVGHNPLPSSVGTFYWTGATGTTFWIDPKEKLVGIMMIQVPLLQTGVYRRAMRQLTYQALNDKGE